jgi:CRISPR-associated endonuclease Csn1
MKNDFPYFNYISKQQFEHFDSQKQELIKQAGIEVSDTKKMSDFNFLFLSHILEYNNNPKEAFSSEGIEYLNKKAKENPTIGKEIKSVTRLDGEVDKEDMFNGGFYETDKGAMAYFVMYENEITKERSGFQSIPTHKAIEKIIKNEPIAEDKEGYKKIILQPGDLVYVPIKEEYEKIKDNHLLSEIIDLNCKKNLENRTYKVVSFSKKDLLCIKSSISDCIIPYDRKQKSKGEIGWDNKSPTTLQNDIIIKEVCIKLKVDRLGNVQLA